MCEGISKDGKFVRQLAKQSTQRFRFMTKEWIKVDKQSRSKTSMLRLICVIHAVYALLLKELLSLMEMLKLLVLQF